MRRLVVFVVCVSLSAVATPVPTGAQTQPQARASREVLTNATVIELVNMGLSDATIVEKIRQSGRNFDTSVVGLRQLKAARVSDDVIREMLGAQTPAPAQSVSSTPNARTLSTAVAGTNPADPLTPHEPGIYLLDNQEMVELNPTTFSGTKANFLGTVLTYGIKKSKMRATVRGASANRSIAQNRPEFYFYFDPSMAAPGMTMAGFLAFGATSPGEFVLVKMDRKTNTRECVIGEYGVFSGMSTGARDKDIHDFTFEKLKPGVFKVVPKADLTPGEYCFYYAGTPAGLGFAGGKLFDFSVGAAG